MNKRKTVYAYINGVRMWDVVQLALGWNVFLDEAKNRILIENSDFSVDFKVERIDEDFDPPAYNHFMCGWLPLDGRGYLRAFQVDSETICWSIDLDADFVERVRPQHTEKIETDECGRRFFRTSYYGDIYLEDLRRCDEADNA